LISQGKEVFYHVKSNPDTLIDEVIEGESYEFEGFWYVAMNAFKTKQAKIYIPISTMILVTNDENYPLLNFNWSPDEPITMGKVCPILYKILETTIKFPFNIYKKRGPQNVILKTSLHLQISYASYINDLEI
jgi:hypothetical protein